MKTKTIFFAAWSRNKLETQTVSNAGHGGEYDSGAHVLGSHPNILLLCIQSVDCVKPAIPRTKLLSIGMKPVADEHA